MQARLLVLVALSVCAVVSAVTQTPPTRFQRLSCNTTKVLSCPDSLFHAACGRERVEFSMWGAIDALRVFGISHMLLQGRLDIDLAPDWSPHGVQRVMDMASSGFFQDIAFFRAVPGFLVQVCVHARAYLPV
jgi:hypothetical protein